MVHIGSIIGSGLSRVTLPFMREQTELRSPKAQRLWVGMGAAAGVAAAFNAPVGGILYSFEEVCSHWPHKLTWRAFFCTIIAAFTFTAVMNTDLGSGLSPGGSVVREALVLNIDSSDGTHTWRYTDFAWAAILSVCSVACLARGTRPPSSASPACASGG